MVIYYGGKIQAMGTLKELLATPDTLRITTPVLPRETLERVLEIVRRDVAADQVRVDNPTQNLESYFLDVVQRARQAAAETSGAISGARVAPYLQSGAQEPPPATEKILDRLALPEAARPVAKPPPTPSAEPAMNEQKLDTLTKAVEPAAAPAQAAPAVKEAPVDLSKADETLSSLLKKSK